MRLFIKKNGLPFSELHFKTGPIYVGRHMHSQVFLPGAAVSRQHAVLYTSEGKWVIEDLDSANKTFLNGNAIHKTEISESDTIGIGEFTIEVELTEEIVHEEPVHMDDTTVTVQHDVSTVVRHAEGKEESPIQLPSRRARDFSRATRTLCRAESLKELHTELLAIMHGQLLARDAWACLRKEPEGPMEFQGGRRVTRETVKRSDLAMQQHIAEAMEKRKYILVPRVPREIAEGTIRSVIIAPILKEKDCHGALYADNSKEHEHYTMADLDYLMLIAIHTAAIMERLA